MSDDAPGIPGRPNAHRRVRVEEPSGRIVAPAKVCAGLIGITAGALHAWTGLSRTEDKLYYVDEVVRRKLDQLRQEDEGEDSLAFHRLREQRARADRLELENDKLRGELVDVADVQRSLDQAVSNAQVRLLNIPISAAPHLANKPREKVEVELERYIRDALEELASWDVTTEEDEDE